MSMICPHHRLNLQGFFSILTAQTLSSGIFEVGSRARLVTVFVGLSLKWKDIVTTPGGEDSVTFALASTVPRRELTLTISPSEIPLAEASLG